MALTALTVVLRAPTLVRRIFDPDEAAIGVQAMVVRAGGTLYTDIFDRKPPFLDTSTSAELGYSQYPTSLVPELQAFITDGYRQIAVVDGVTVWQRTS